MNTRRILAKFGITEPALSELADKDKETVTGWIRHIQDQDHIYNPAGFLIAQLRQDLPAPEQPDPESVYYAVSEWNSYCVS